MKQEANNNEINLEQNIALQFNQVASSLNLNIDKLLWDRFAVEGCQPQVTPFDTS